MANIFLIGPMGAGKTTVGKQLARRLCRPFFDSDHEIVAVYGVDIPTIFDFEGEAGFRRREARMLDILTKKQDIVLATGGGAVLREENRQRLKSRGIVVYLDVDLDVQYERTTRDKTRPLLANHDPRVILQEMSRLRGPIYRATADIRISTSRQKHRRVVDKICRSMEIYEQRQPRMTSSMQPKRHKP